MWLLYYRIIDHKSSFYEFCISSPSKVGYKINDFDEKISINNKIFRTAYVYLRKENSNKIKKETSKLLEYLHTFDDRIEWQLCKLKKKGIKHYKLIPSKLESNF